MYHGLLRKYPQLSGRNAGDFLLNTLDQQSDNARYCLFCMQFEVTAIDSSNERIPCVAACNDEFVREWAIEMADRTEKHAGVRLTSLAAFCSYLDEFVRIYIR